MSILLLIYFILVKMILVVDAAPKMGIALLDPLMFESSDSHLSDEMMVPDLRRDMSRRETEMQCEGYIFNDNKCIQINNRILCGYDKNKGDKLNYDTIVNMGDGCRSRGDRIECGYENGQYRLNDLRPLENGKHVDQTHDKVARHAPTRTSTTTPHDIYKRMRTDLIENKLLKSAFDKLLMKSENKQSVATLLTKLITPITSYTSSSSSITETMLTTASEIPTLLTTRIESTPNFESSQTSESTKTESTPTFENTQLSESAPSFESTQTSEITKTETTPTLSTTKITTTQTTENSESDDYLFDADSHADAIKRIVHIQHNKRSDQEEESVRKIRRLTDTSSTLSELDTESKPDIVSTTNQPINNNCENTTSSNTDLRMQTSEKKISTACVEQNDRVVCYDFKT